MTTQIDTREEEDEEESIINAYRTGEVILADESTTNTVKEWTQSHLWSSCKFIEQSHVQGAKLENKDNIFNDVFRSLNKPNIRVREKIIFLNTYAKIIYDAIGEYRCSAQSMYKKEALEGKVIYLQLFF